MPVSQAPSFVSSFSVQVYLPAIPGHVPDEMVKAIRAFLEFCYLVRRSVISEDTLEAVDNALACFHRHREIFRHVGVRDNFNLPRQHSLVHYHQMIQMFGAPNGLCSSITESKHIKAVKKPWRRSNKHEPLVQMLTTNQCVDKLAAARVHYDARDMLSRSILPDRYFSIAPQPDAEAEADDDSDDDDAGAVDGPTSLGGTSLARCAGMCFFVLD